jgi:predicted MFS family arabinose efflux permease
MVLRPSFFELTKSDSPAFRELFNKHVPSRIRATVISTNSFNMNIGELLGVAILGVFAIKFGLQPLILLAAVLLIASSFIYLVLKK